MSSESLVTAPSAPLRPQPAPLHPAWFASGAGQLDLSFEFGSATAEMTEPSSREEDYRCDPRGSPEPDC